MTIIQKLQAAATAIERQVAMVSLLLKGRFTDSESTKRRVLMYLDSVKHNLSVLDSVKTNPEWCIGLSQALTDASTDPEYLAIDLVGKDDTVIIQGAFDIEKLRRTLVTLPVRAV